MLHPASSFPSLCRVDTLADVGTATVCDPQDLPPDCPLAGRTSWPLHCGRPVAVLCLGDNRLPGDEVDLTAAALATALALGEIQDSDLSHEDVLRSRGVLFYPAQEA